MSDDSHIERSDVRRSPDAAAPAGGAKERNPNIEREVVGDDEAVDRSLRPKSFSEFIGQESIKENLGVMVQSAQMRDDTLDHVLLCGPPGLGKTTLAHILSREMNANIHVTSGPALEQKKDLAGILSSLDKGDMLFIDECHRLNAVIEENLYPAMEDYYFDIVIGNGPHARSMKLSLPPFTMVGATTRAGLVSAPLRSRFGQVARLNYYSSEQLEAVIKRSAKLLDIGLTDDGSSEIARRSRGTPRIANRLLRRVRDWAVVEELDAIDRELARFALGKLEIDDAGFDALDRLYLKTLTDKFGGGPAGLSTMASAIDEEKDTIETVIEPFLLQEGYIRRTPQGRVATRAAFDHMEVPYPTDDQSSLL
ncbi:MAG: Holliday junction branch migration DNA helicase RuvB [Persicimonas sp.]